MAHSRKAALFAILLALSRFLASCADCDWLFDKARKESEEMLRAEKEQINKKDAIKRSFKPITDGDEGLCIETFSFLLKRFGSKKYIYADDYRLPEAVFDALKQYAPCRFAGEDADQSPCKEQLTIIGKLPQKNGDVRVKWSRYSSPLNAETGVLTLKRSEGKWKVVGNRAAGIS